MSDIILISKVGLYETVKCAICENPNQTERGCDGSCQYDKKLHVKIVEAVEGIAEQRPHGEWVENTRYKRKGKKFLDCSRCHYGENGDIICEVSKLPNFCPNCGASMRTKGGDST